MDHLLAALRRRYRSISFAPGKTFYWSAKQRVVYYPADAHGAEAGWALLHETGHALLDHHAYGQDFELLEMELAAWQKARSLSKAHRLEIPEDHVQDCLDTYRSWLYGRSICPTCETVALQHDDTQRYECFNCGSSWSVATSRFCRPYRSARQTKNPSARIALTNGS